MIRKERIILMSKLAIYDKYLGETDRKQSEYFRHDYIYRKNIWTRFTAGLGAFILWVLHWLHKFYTEGIDLEQLDIQKELFSAAFFIVAVLLLYTLIGTIIATREYNLGQKRLKSYFLLLNKLDHLSQDSSPPSEEDLYGTDVVYTRNRD